MLTRLLVASDLEAALALAEKHRAISGIRADRYDWTSLQSFLRTTLYASAPRARLIGCFDGDVLKGFISQYLSEHQPAWYLTLIVQETERWLGTGHGTYVNACLQDAIQHAESRGFFEVFYSVPTKWLRTTKRTHPRSPIWSRYNVYIEDIVPAGKEPRFSSHVGAFGNIIRDFDVAIKRCSLKTEHRLAYFKEQGYEYDTLVEE
jgi:hypothetical protein